MTESLAILLDYPVTVFLILAAGSVIGIAVEKFFTGIEREKRRAYWQGRNRTRGKIVNLDTIRRLEAEQDDKTKTAADQLRQVMQASFKARALLNKPERRLLSCIDKALADHSPGWRAMGQVSLGEILYSADRNAFWAINAKRVDLLIIDADCRPLHAIEFQGTGHHSGPETAARDAVKKEALRRAGVGYIEVVSGDTPADVREMVRKMVERTKSA